MFRFWLLILLVFTVSYAAFPQPMTRADYATTTKNTAVTFNVLANDEDLGGNDDDDDDEDDDDLGLDPSTLDLDPTTTQVNRTMQTPDGEFTAATNGDVTFIPAREFVGDAIHYYTVRNKRGERSDPTMMTVRVTNVNAPPVAVDDAVTTREGVPVTVNVLANDSDDDGTLDPATVQLSDPAGGTFVGDGAGNVTYTPASGFTGTASVRYTVNDNEGATSNTATLTVTVIANKKPVANPDAVTTNQNTPVTINILENDTDEDGSLDPATVVLGPDPAGGAFTVNASGVVNFTPARDFTGTARTTYTVKDNDGASSNEAAITVTVVRVNTPPIARNDNGSTVQDRSVTISVLENDEDPDGSINAATVQLSNAVGGTFSVNASGIVTFTPTPGFIGTASANYTVKDNEGATSNVATITITVEPDETPPVANDDAATTDEDHAITIRVLDNDEDHGSGLDPASVTLGGDPPGGVFTVNASGVVTFTPAKDYHGVASTTYTVRNKRGILSNTATIEVTVLPVNDPPVANPDVATTNQGVPVTIPVLNNDTDVDSRIDPTTVQITDASGGTFLTTSSGSVVFTPAPGFSGTATANYSVKDVEGSESNTTTITVTVVPVATKPVAVDDVAITNEDEPVSFNVVANDVDPDGTIDPATVTFVGPFTGGTFTVNASGVVTFTPEPNFHGTAIARYTVRDNSGETSNEATITVTVLSVNDAPVAVDDAATTEEGRVVSINVIANDIDIDGTIDPATVSLGANTTGGSFAANAQGIVTFTPAPGFYGLATATYTVKDNAGAVSNIASITITVIRINDAPVAVPDEATTNQNVGITINILSNDYDPDGVLDPTSVTILRMAGGTFVSNTLGEVTFTPAPDFVGTATAVYTVNDMEGAVSNEAQISVTVHAVNDAPIAINDTAVTDEDVAITLNVLANDSDPNNAIDPATVDLDIQQAGIQNTVSLPSGTFTVDGQGNVTYTPTPDFYGAAVAAYTVNNKNGKTSNQATITITVNPVNDPPVFARIPDQRILQNAPEQLLVIEGVSAGPNETEEMHWVVTSSNPSLIPAPKITYNGTGSTASLTYKPALNQSGTVEITVKLMDSGNLEYVQTFRIEVIEVKIISTPDTVAEAGEHYHYTIQITPVPETLTILVTEKPAWLKLTAVDQHTAQLTGTAPLTGSSINPVRIEVRHNDHVLAVQHYNLIVNQRPVVSDFALAGDEDVAMPLPRASFQNAYHDPDGHPLRAIQFVRFPRHGKVMLESVTVSAEEGISLEMIERLRYVPDNDYFGTDTLYWKGSDGFSYSAQPARVLFTIYPVNDPPVVTLENDSMQYEAGSNVAQPFTEQLNITDVDDEFLEGAVIMIRPETFQVNSDRLEYINTDAIRGVYETQTGVLTLTGRATLHDYVMAIRNVKYVHSTVTDLQPADRVIAVSVRDRQAQSDTVERVIDLIYTFRDLDIPNGFTPNGDRANDTWRITSPQGLDQYRNAEVRVYDKRGQLVFESIGFQREWDGMYQGAMLPTDTYYYVIDLKYNQIRYKGIVTILR